MFGNRPAQNQGVRDRITRRRLAGWRERRRRLRGEPTKGGRPGCLGRVPMLALVFVTLAWAAAKVVA